MNRTLAVILSLLAAGLCKPSPNNQPRSTDSNSSTKRETSASRTTIVTCIRCSVPTWWSIRGAIRCTTPTPRPALLTDQAAGTAGMKLMERPEPQASGANYGDVVVQVHASGFTGDELIDDFSVKLRDEWALISNSPELRSFPHPVTASLSLRSLLQ